MKCYLMNKNTAVLSLEYKEEINAFVEILDVMAIEYAPLSIFKAYNEKHLSLLKEINNWFRDRGIPRWRKDLTDLLDRLDIQSTDELLTKAYGLSLSDQYWIKPKGLESEWKDINFFQNDFKYKGYLEASFSFPISEEVSLYSPNNTTDGMVKKAWILQDGKRVLLKDSYLSDRMEPMNEWLCSIVCERLGIDHCVYETSIYNGRLVSLCENMITPDTEIVSAYDIYTSEKKDNSINDYEHFISILEKHDVPDAWNSVNDMFIIDYLLMNTDRHMKNFGVIRNVNTLQWEKTIPIFDTGQSMQTGVLDNQINFNDGYGKFFRNTNKRFNFYFDTLKLNKKYDLSLLDDVPELLEEKMLNHLEYLNISPDKLDKIVSGIEHRIEKLRNHLYELNALLDHK